MRHFLTLMDIEPAALKGIVARASELKRMHRDKIAYRPMENQVLGMIFEKSSTRTRVSFEVAMAHFGGSSIFLSPRDTQLGRGEPIADSARVISSMVDAVMIRTFSHEMVEAFAEHSSVPVINALTDLHHPCQLLADMQAYAEHRGDIAGKKVVWIGDGNNMCHSYMNAAEQFGFELHVACPEGFLPDSKILEQHKSVVTLHQTPQEAVKNADLIATDVWASMGQEDEAQARKARFAPYQVNANLMAGAKSDALFMHCLPAHRGEEVSAEVIDGNQSVVWDEAENRLHAQKALLEYLCCQTP